MGERQPLDLRAASVIIEQHDGHDSIPTIETHYRHEVWSDRAFRYVDSGSFICPFPSCKFKRKDAAAMWRHVHLTGAHGHSWMTVRSDADAIALADRIRAAGVEVAP